MNLPAAGEQQRQTPLETVVVPLDGSVLAAAALGPAAALAHATGASLQLLSTAWDGRLEEPRAYLERRAARTGLDRVQITVDPQRPAPDAILHAEQRSGTVVCMATHGRSGLTDAVIGSVATAVLHGSSRPVLLVGPNTLSRLSTFEAPNLLVSLDGSPLSEMILPVGLEWARLLDLAPRLVQVVDPVPELAKGADAAESGYLKQVADRTQDAGLSWDVLHGHDPAAALGDYAARLPASLLVLATHGRTGPARLALGSVAMGAVHRSPCPVLVARPHALRHASA